MVTAIAALLSGCAADPGSRSWPGVITVAPTGEIVRVRAIDNFFRPEQLTVKVGDGVEFSNGGRNDHDITPKNRDGNWGVTLAGFKPKDVFMQVFTQPGVYEYFCTIHATNAGQVGMIGTIIVTE